MNQGISGRGIGPVRPEYFDLSTTRANYNTRKRPFWNDCAIGSPGESQSRKDGLYRTGRIHTDLASCFIWVT